MRNTDFINEYSKNTKRNTFRFRHKKSDLRNRNSM